jgi:putative transposase
LQDRRLLFGRVDGFEMILNSLGRYVLCTWLAIHEHHPHVSVDACVVMPNHLHGILVLSRDVPGARGWDLERAAVTSRAYVLGDIVRAFKATTGRYIRSHGLPCFQWQRGLYEHVIEDDAEMFEVQEYIRRNPEEWQRDRENPVLDRPSRK